MTTTNTLATKSASVPATLTALKAVAEIKALRKTAAHIAQMLEAQLHEQLWIIRNEFDHESDFTRFVELELDIKPTESVARVKTWDVARRSRPVRELAQQSGRDTGSALALVNKLIESGAEDALSNDAEVARLLTLPGRKLTKEIRRLIDQAPPAGPAEDRGRADESEAQLAAQGGSRASRAATQLMTDLRGVETSLASLIRQNDSNSAHTWSPHQANAVRRYIDLAYSHLDALSERLAITDVIG